MSVAELRAAQRIVPIATVQNLYNLVERSSEELVRVTAELGVGFIPWFPLATGGLIPQRRSTRGDGSPRRRLASQIALAWLLQHASNVLPIPGRRARRNLEENVPAAAVRLSPAEVLAALDRAA